MCVELCVAIGLLPGNDQAWNRQDCRVFSAVLSTVHCAVAIRVIRALSKLAKLSKICTRSCSISEISTRIAAVFCDGHDDLSAVYSCGLSCHMGGTRQSSSCRFGYKHDSSNLESQYFGRDFKQCPGSRDASTVSYEQSFEQGCLV